LFSVSSVVQAEESSEPGFASGEVVVKLKTVVAQGAAIKSLAALGVAALDPSVVEGAEALFAAPAKKVRSLRRGALESVLRLKLRGGADVQSTVAALLKDPLVEYAQPNYFHHLDFTPRDPRFGEQWALAKIQAEKAWDIQRGSPDVLIAIIDTGIDYNHEELRQNLWINPGEDSNHNGGVDSTDFNGLDDDGNGFVDDLRGWDFTDAPNFADGGDYLDPDNDPMDENGHGTAVAGIIGAGADNGIGVAGLAHGCRMMNLRAGTSRGFLEEDDVASAIVYAVDNGARVINMSFGDVVASPLLRDVVQYAYDRGAILVASAGNSATDAIHYPSGFDETISVGATTPDDGLAGFSNFGATVDVVAPGADVLSTAPGDRYGNFSGTSAAAPFVSALAALVLSEHPTLTPEQVKGLLESTADDLGDPGWDSFYAAGRLNARRALEISDAPTARILSPRMDEGFSSGPIPIRGTAAWVQLREYHLDYGVGVNPKAWVEIQRGIKRQVIDDSLGVWNLEGLADTTYTLRLRLLGYDGSSVEDKVVILLDRTAPRISDVRIYEMIDGDDYSALVEFSTDDLCHAAIWFRRALSEESFAEIPLAFITREHRINLRPERVGGNGNFEFFIRAINRAGLVSDENNADRFYPLSFTRPRIESADFGPLDHRLPSGYLLNKVSDFDGDGVGEVILNQYRENFAFDRLRIYEWQPTGFREVFASPEAAIPRDWGDSNGDGKLEILAGAGPRSFIYESPRPGEFPSRIVWADTNDFWASRFADLDGDGQGEIIARVGNTFTVWANLESGGHRFALVDSLPNPTTGTNATGVPHTEVADFDGDGRQEILMGDYDGDVYIYEGVGPNRFRFTWSDRLPLLDTIDFLSQGDYDGDGLVEFAVGCHSDPRLDSEQEFDSRHWLYRIYKREGDDSFRPIWQARFFGFQPPQDFDSGVSSGDIDRDGRDELLINVFPDFYVVDFDPDRKEFVPLWHYLPNRSNVAVVGDLDGNGVKEFYFNDGTQIIGFEKLSATSGPPVAIGLRASPLDSERVRVQWKTVPQAEGYFVYRGTDRQTLWRQAFTRTSEYLDAGLMKDVEYWYAVSVIDSSATPMESRRSAMVRARPNNNPFLRAAVFVPPNHLRLTFSEPLGASAKIPTHYDLRPEVGHPSSAVWGQSGQEIILTIVPGFPRPGEYRVTARGLFDLEGTPLDTTRRMASFAVQSLSPAPYIVSAELVGESELVVRFSEALEPATITDPSHYRLRPWGQVKEARLDSQDPRTVRLRLDPAMPLGALGVSFTLEVRGVRSVAGVEIIPGQGDRTALIFTAPNLHRMFVYPNPCRASEGKLVFANLTSRATIKIMTASGEVLRTLKETDGNGGVEWDLTDERGHRVGSGIYLYLATNDRGERKVGKFAVVR